MANSVLTTIADPMLTAMQFLIPLAVCISGIHKLMEHQASAGAFLVEMLIKGGGAVLVITVIKALIPNYT